MRAVSGRNLLLGLRWNGPPTGRACRRIERFLEEITALETRGPAIPLHWHLTPALHLEGSAGPAEDLIASIRNRLRDGGDQVLAPGYAGAVHPLLGAAELAEELRWSRENPWRSGIGERFGFDLEVLLPSYPDLVRESTAGVYRRHGFRALGIDGSGLPPGDRRFLYSLPSGDSPAAPLPIFLFHPLPFALLGGGRGELKAFLRGPRQWPLFLLIDVDGDGTGDDEPAADALRSGLELLVTRSSRRLIALPEALRQAEAAPPLPILGLPLPAFAPDPVQRAAWRKRLRARAQGSAEATRRVLLAGSPTLREPAAAPPAARHGGRENDQRVVTAGITGTAVLTGPTFEALFHNGQFAGLLRSVMEAGDRYLHGTLASSYLKISGRRYEFQPRSCVSFERPDGLGVSAMLALETGEADFSGSITADYTILDGRAELRLDLAVEYPVLPGGALLEESVPLEIPLSRFGPENPLELVAEQSDGPAYRRPLPAREGRFALSGRRFIIEEPARRLVLAWPETRPAEQHLLQFRTRRAGRGGDLLCNPFGSYFPTGAERTSGRRDEFSLLLTLETLPA